MAISRRFVVKKDAHEETITYMEYEKLKGFNVKPKDSFEMDDMINVNGEHVFVPVDDSSISKISYYPYEKIYNDNLGILVLGAILWCDKNLNILFIVILLKNANKI